MQWNTVEHKRLIPRKRGVSVSVNGEKVAGMS